MTTVNSVPETGNATRAEMTQAEFAALRGVQPPMVTRWKQRGLLVMTADGTRVRVAESLARLNASLHPGRGGDRTGRSDRAARSQQMAADLEAKGSYAAEAAREKRASAQLKELELAVEAKKLVDAEAARDATVRRVQAAKAEMMRLPRRVAPACARETDVGVIERMLLEEMRAICIALASGLPPSDQAQAEQC